MSDLVNENDLSSELCNVPSGYAAAEGEVWVRIVPDEYKGHVASSGTHG